MAVTKSVIFTALANDSNGNPLLVSDNNWKWTTASPSVTLNASGDHATVTGKSVGTAQITVEEMTSHNKATATLSIANAENVTPNPDPGGGTVDPGSPATNIPVYSNDFSNGAGPTGLSGVTGTWSLTRTDVTPRGARKFLGHFSKETASLTLNNLPKHSAAVVSFDLFIIRSWDGNTTAPFGPDVWELNVTGGPTLLHTTFSNVDKSLVPTGVENFPQGFFQAFPGSAPGGRFPFATGAAEASTLGYTFAGKNDDSVYRLKYVFVHTGAKVQINFKGAPNQPIDDESWGITNVKVSLKP